MTLIDRVKNILLTPEDRVAEDRGGSRDDAVDLRRATC